MNKICFYLFFSFVGLSVMAQSETQPEIITDRPSQTESAFVIPRGYFQIETGFQYTEGVFLAALPDGALIFLEQENFTYNTSLFRYGLNDKIELRLIQSLGSTKFSGFSSDTRLGPTFIGAKLNLAEAKGASPQVAFLAHIGGPILSNLGRGTQADFRLSLEHRLSDKLVLGYNLGGLLENDLNDFKGLYTVVFGYDIAPKLNVFAEVFGTTRDSATRMAMHNFDFGFAYRVNANFQLDTYFGTAISDFGPDTILGLGASLRLPKKN